MTQKAMVAASAQKEVSRVSQQEEAVESPERQRAASPRTSLEP
jgi:hypothetical protein